MSEKFYRTTDEFTDFFGGTPIYFKVNSEGRVFCWLYADSTWLDMTGPHPVTQYKDEEDLVKCYSHRDCSITEVEESEVGK